MRQAWAGHAVPAPATPGRFCLPLPAGAAGRWCLVAVRVRGAWWGKLEAASTARGQVVREAFLGPRRRCGARRLLMHVPGDASELGLQVFTPDGSPPGAAWVRLLVLGRVETAMRLLLGGAGRVPGCLRGDPAGFAARLRTELGQAPARAGEAPPYELWLRLYDRWGAAERDALRLAGEAPAMEVAVIGRGDAAATLASLGRQWLAPARVTQVKDAATLPRLPGAWLVVVQAGDRLAPHALACLAHAARGAPEARLLHADVDRLGAEGRHTPLLKPHADPMLLLGGLTLQGACAWHPGQPAGVLGAWPVRHVPFVLTHGAAIRPARAPQAGPALQGRPTVSIVIASACRSALMLRCLRGVLDGTDYPDFEVLLAVSRVDPGDRAQRRVLAAVAGLARVRLLDLGMAAFNYAAVNNAGARAAQGALLLLLNDDVRPAHADWLTRMVALTQDRVGGAAAIVGARLLYGHGRVQHGGVTMGLAHLCEHTFRLLRRHDPGPHGLALADRQVAAVTGACMLVRRALWEELGGMDEGFAVALNDVDFCLRAGAAGARVALAAGAVLYHYEGQSLGRHYRGARAGLEAVEVQRLQARWRSAIADDPFYTPQASLEPGREFQPAFPPRLTPSAWIAGEDAGWR